jgi:hypothetical protein
VISSAVNGASDPRVSSGINPAPLDAAANWIDAQRVLWSARLDALDALLKDEDREAAQTNRKRGR